MTGDKIACYDEQANKTKIDKLDKELKLYKQSRNETGFVYSPYSCIVALTLLVITCYMTAYSWYVYNTLTGPCKVHNQVHLSNDIQHFDNYTIEFNNVIINITDVHVSNVIMCTYLITTNELRVGSIITTRTVSLLCTGWMMLFLADLFLFLFIRDVYHLCYILYKIHHNERQLWHLRGKLV